MSMVLLLVTLSDANIARILENPPLVWRVFQLDDPEPYLRALGESSRWWAKREPVPNMEMQIGEGERLDLDKAWHGIHYLLNKTAEESEDPSSFLISGGQQVGNINVGYGPARAYLAEEVRAIDTALSAADGDVLRSNFDLAEMIRQKVYPLMNDSDRDETLEYLMSYAEVLRVTVRRATEYRLGMVLAIT